MRSDHAKVRSELSRLSKQNKLTAAYTVAVASNPKSALHACFEWDDKIAGVKYRLEQARELISSFEITVRVEHRNVEVQEFVHHPHKSKTGGGYVGTVELRDQPDAARDFVQGQLQIAEAYVRKAADFATVLKVEGETRDLADRLRTLRARVSEAAA